MKWKHKIKIKHLFEENTTPELIITLCNELIRQLTPIMEKYGTSDDGDDIYYNLEMCVDNFEHLKNLANDSISKDTWAEYGFMGDFEEEFNDMLSLLYDVADENKLIWIE